MKSRLIRTGWKLIDFLFPPCCGGCGKWGESYCEDCFASTKIIKSPICHICGQPLMEQSRTVCNRCQVKDIHFAAVRSWAIFEAPLNAAIHQLKYNRNIGLGEVLAEPLTALFQYLDWDIDLITAVPLDPKSKIQRGYNQSVLLARPVARNTGITFNHQILSRSFSTKPQVGLSRQEREDNLRDVFRVDKRIAVNRSILIVDDVITTGSTINECSKELMRGGAKKVYGLTLARMQTYKT